MENNILPKEKILELVNQFPDHFTQILRSSKNYKLYGNTFSYIDTSYNGNKFSEKLYKYIYGERKCKKCNTLLTSKQFRSFFGGYMEEFCSKKCALHSDERTNHIKQTKLGKYGSSSYNNLPKQQATMLARHGVKHNWSGNGSLREKCYETNLKLYGARHPINNYQHKKYILPSGKIIKVQGYEPFALDYLLKIYNENDLVSNRKTIPKFYYITYDNKKHIYYPDIFVKSKNLIVEVKSKWTSEFNPTIDILKERAVISSGYKFQKMIFNSKGKLTNE